MPCTLAALAAELPAGKYGPVFILPSFSGQIHQNEEKLRALPFRYFVLNYGGVTTRYRLPGLHEVCYDHYGDGFILGKMLGRSGCRHLIMLSSLSNMQWSRDRCNGLCDGLRLFAPEAVVPAVPSSAAGVREVMAFCRRNGPESLVICANSDYAASVCSFFSREGMIRGLDYKLLSFADETRCRERSRSAVTSSPRATTSTPVRR